MGISGADVPQLKALATKFESTWATQLDTLISSVDTAVQGSRDNIWLGKDAEEFRNVIWPGHKKALQAARAALVEAGTTAKRNAEAQDTTSTTVA